MYYEINVSKNGFHFFATHERSITDSDKLKKVYNALRERFMESDGYEITVTKITKTGTTIKMN